MSKLCLVFTDKLEKLIYEIYETPCGPVTVVHDDNDAFI